jgi:hypothetical protein
MAPELTDEHAGLVFAVDQATAAVEAQEAVPYSGEFLRWVHSELIAMRDQWPSFPFSFGRAIVDWPEYELGDRLLRFGRRFERARTQTGNGR